MTEYVNIKVNITYRLLILLYDIINVRTIIIEMSKRNIININKYINCFTHKVGDIFTVNVARLFDGQPAPLVTENSSSGEQLRPTSYAGCCSNIINENIKET